MSSIYSLEPNTNGKVILNTTLGPLVIELWSKECPLATRNFIQLCMEGYYDQSPFHRVVPGFCVQTGRPAKTYAGHENYSKDGSSIFNGDGFAVETHSRLKFTRRGLLGMVASTAESDPRRYFPYIKLKRIYFTYSSLPFFSSSPSLNNSQFFFTLSEASELNGKTTLFGRLAGDSIFNLLRIGELEVDSKTECPLYPPLIINTEIISNPFNDIIPRQLTLTETFTASTSSAPTIKPAVLKKNRALLSFSTETETEEGSNETDSGIKSSHDLLNDSKLSKSSHEQSKSKLTNQSKTSSNFPSNKKLESEQTTGSSSSLQFLQQMKAMQMRETQKKIEEVEKELGMCKRVENAKTTTTTAPVTAAAPMSALEKHRMKFMSATSGKKRKSSQSAADDEMETLLMLNSFRQKIQKSTSSDDKSVEKAAQEQEITVKKHLDICKLHGLVDCLSCRDTFGISNNVIEEGNSSDWLMHKLVFDRRALDQSIRDDLNQLVVIDPKEQAEKILKKR